MTYPEVQRLFWPRFNQYTSEELWNSPELQTHAQNIMFVIDYVIVTMVTITDATANKTSPGDAKVEDIFEMLHNLGRKHINYKTKPIYFDVSNNVKINDRLSLILCQ